MDLISRRALLAGAAGIKLPRKLRLGMVGLLGHAGEILTPLPHIPDVELVAVAEADAGELEKIKKRPVAAKAPSQPQGQGFMAATSWKRAG